MTVVISPAYDISRIDTKSPAKMRRNRWVCVWKQL